MHPSLCVSSFASLSLLSFPLSDNPNPSNTPPPLIRRPYSIDGSEMELRSGNSPLVRCITQFAGAGGHMELEMRRHFSLQAYGVLLLELAGLLCERFLAHLGALSLTEWGALLLHQEALATVKILEEASEATQSNVRGPLLPLLWALKLVSVNQLADLRHYTVPAGTLDEAAARRLLERRVDFSPEAVAKCRLKLEVQSPLA